MNKVVHIPAVFVSEGYKVVSVTPITSGNYKRVYRGGYGYSYSYTEGVIIVAEQIR